MKLSDTDFPRRVRERMEQVLLPGDEVLWAARPLPGWDSRLHEFGGTAHTPFMLFFTLFWCAGCGLFLFVVGKMMADKSNLSLSYIFAFFLIPFVCIGVALICKWCRVIFRGDSRYYAITRHFLLMDEKGRLDARPIKPNMILKTEIYAQGQGHIYLKGDEEREGMFHLPDVRMASDIYSRAVAESRHFTEPLHRQTEAVHRDLLTDSILNQLLSQLTEGEKLLRVASPPAPVFFWKSQGCILLMLLFIGTILYDYFSGLTIPCPVWCIFGLCLLILSGVAYSICLRRCRNKGFTILTNRSLGWCTPGQTPKLTPLADFQLKNIIIDSRGNTIIKSGKSDICYPAGNTDLLAELLYRISASR